MLSAQSVIEKLDLIFPVLYSQGDAVVYEVRVLFLFHFPVDCGIEDLMDVMLADKFSNSRKNPRPFVDHEGLFRGDPDAILQH